MPSGLNIKHEWELAQNFYQISSYSNLRINLIPVYYYSCFSFVYKSTIKLLLSMYLVKHVNMIYLYIVSPLITVLKM